MAIYEDSPRRVLWYGCAGLVLVSAFGIHSALSSWKERILQDYAVQKRTQQTEQLFDNLDVRIDEMTFPELEEAYDRSTDMTQRIQGEYMRALRSRPVRELSEQQKQSLQRGLNNERSY